MIKNVYELEEAVNNYMKRKGIELKYSQLDVVENSYNVLTMDYTQIESKIINMKNGRTKVLFKVDGKITSIYK
ncbi:MAG: hypothetical protein ACI4VL_02350 [Bacilli bacterium]